MNVPPLQKAFFIQVSIWSALRLSRLWLCLNITWASVWLIEASNTSLSYCWIATYSV